MQKYTAVHYFYTLISKPSFCILSHVVVSTILTNYLPSFQNQDILISQICMPCKNMILVVKHLKMTIVSVIEAAL